MDFIRSILSEGSAAAERVLGPVEEPKVEEVRVDEALKFCPFQSLPGFLSRRDPAQTYPEYRSCMKHADKQTFLGNNEKAGRASFLFMDGEGNFYPHRPAVSHDADVQFMSQVKEKGLTLAPRKLRRVLGRIERKRYARIVAARAKRGYPSQEASGVERSEVVEQVGDGA